MRAFLQDRQDLSPALIASAVLHATVAILLMIQWPWARDLKIGTVVPVKIVTNAPTTDLRPAIEAPTEQTAMTETPVPDAPLEAAPPAPEPEPTPPAPTPKAAPPPKPAPTPPKPTPPPPKPAPTPKAATPPPKPAPPQKAPPAKSPPAKAAEKSLDFDALLASVSKSKAGGRPSSAQKGPSRPETATQARPAAGTGLSASALAGLTEELQRRWNPNCDVEGGRDVRLEVTFGLGSAGQVVGNVTAGGQENSSNAVIKAAAERAIAAVYGASPFRTLPRELYGQRFKVKFDARTACSM